MDELFTIEYYETDTGKCPYLEWEDELTMELRAQIRKRLNRVRLGNFGDIDHIEGSIFELRIHAAAGYRIYYAKKAIKSLFYFVLVVREAKIEILLRLKNTGKI